MNWKLTLLLFLFVMIWVGLRELNKDECSDQTTYGMAHAEVAALAGFSNNYGDDGTSHKGPSEVSEQRTSIWAGVVEIQWASSPRPKKFVGRIVSKHDPEWTLERVERLAACESGGNWSINTGNGFFGGIQFSQSSWELVGGTGSPHEASKEEQIARGKLLWDRQGWLAWPGCSCKFKWISQWRLHGETRYCW